MKPMTNCIVRRFYITLTLVFSVQCVWIDIVGCAAVGMFKGEFI